MPFFIIFVVIPFIEILVFFEVADSIGFFQALGLTVLSALIGAAIIKYQGLQTLGEIQTALDRGRVPLGELFDGMCMIIAGLLLIVPGFVTDFFGFIMLIPFARNPMRHFVRTYIYREAEVSSTENGDDYYNRPRKTAHKDVFDGEIIEGEYERLDDSRE